MIWKFGTWSDDKYTCGQCGRTKRTVEEARAHEMLTASNSDICLLTMNPLSRSVTINRLIKSHV